MAIGGQAPTTYQIVIHGNRRPTFLHVRRYNSPMYSGYLRQCPTLKMESAAADTYCCIDADSWVRTVMNFRLPFQSAIAPTNPFVLCFSSQMEVTDGIQNKKLMKGQNHLRGGKKITPTCSIHSIYSNARTSSAVFCNHVS